IGGLRASLIQRNLFSYQHAKDEYRSQHHRGRDQPAYHVTIIERKLVLAVHGGTVCPASVRVKKKSLKRVIIPPGTPSPRLRTRGTETCAREAVACTSGTRIPSPAVPGWQGRRGIRRAVLRRDFGRAAASQAPCAPPKSAAFAPPVCATGR